MRSSLILLALAALTATSVDARMPRSAAEKHAFQRATPCPATGLRRGNCPGYVIDHVQPLCAGGLDHPSNMQWQTIAAGKAKDSEERRACARLKVR